MRLKVLRLATGVLAAWLVGCGAIGGSGAQKTAHPAEPERPQPDMSPVAPLLEMMSSLPQGDPARQAEIFQSAKDAASLTPTTSNKLRLALVLATPGHSGADPVAAQRQLSELLARPETLLPTERFLAQVALKDVEEQLILQAENQRLRDEASHDDSRDKLLATNRRLTAETDENARLRKALDEARAKLEAVTHLERSINDRGTSGSQTP
jgi:hypothetical protein